MTSDEYAKWKETELFANLLQHEDKKVSDRTNIFALAQTIFFNAFVGLVTSENGVSGLFVLFPVIVSATGFVFSIVWIFQNQIRLDKIVLSMKDIVEKGKAPFSLDAYSAIADKMSEKAKSVKAKYEWLPIGFAVAWTLILIVYVLKVTNVVAF